MENSEVSRLLVPAPAVPERPMTWTTWSASEGSEFLIEELGIVSVIKNEYVEDSWGDITGRALVFQISDCGENRFYRAVFETDSYGERDALETFESVTVTTKTVTTYEVV